jgi:hypothetical protein
LSFAQCVEQDLRQRAIVIGVKMLAESTTHLRHGVEQVSFRLPGVVGGGGHTNVDTVILGIGADVGLWAARQLVEQL